VDWKQIETLRGSPVPPDLLDNAQTVTEALAALCGDFPQFEGLIIVDRERGPQQLSLGAIWKRARDVQSHYVERGLTRGGFTLIVLPTGPELVSAYLATLLAGGVPALIAMPANRLADQGVYARRIGAILENAQAQILHCTPDVAGLFEGECGQLLGAAARVVPSDVTERSNPPPVVDSEPDGIATVQYSSGSTGSPKGVLLTHRAVLNNVRAIREGLALTRDDVSVNWIPLYHDMGLMGAFLLPLLNGCPTVLIPTMDFMREPSLWLWAVHRYRGTISFAPNFGYALCAKRVPDADVDGLDLSSWQRAMSAAEPVLAETIDAFTHRYVPHGFRASAMTPAWGMAETVLLATVHPIARPPRVETIDRQVLATAGEARATTDEGLRVVAVGRCLPHSEVEIRDPEGRAVPDRHVGTIWLRSNSLLARYHRDAALTATVLVDGWLNTGDRGYVDDGDLFFVSREKDLVVIAGEKYAPHDIEAAINHVSGVREGCVVAFGVANRERGTEDIAAVVETKETDEDRRAQLRDAIRAEVTRATGLALRYVLLVSPGGVEKTTSGKLARMATQRRYAEQIARL
jgi:acyl-CoA synthetase (AMP-forming)/AMP-acid ligase II